ncbi:MAG: GFA family protein [Paracoccaceae bacterium]
MSGRRGGCLCGAVRFQIAPFTPVFGACHCKMCQRWAGSALLALTVPGDTLIVSGDAVKTHDSSAWAERSFCGTCGSGLWYKTKGENVFHIAIGLLDDTTGLTLKSEIYHDLKPDCFALSTTSKKYTAAETMAMYAPEEAEK